VSTHKIKILLIDDDKNANFYNQRIIEKTQLAEEVISFENAKMALEYLKKQNGERKYPSPDIIFLDINMPGMDGWEFLEQYTIRKSTQKLNTKIIMLSSSDNNDDRDRAARFDVVSNYICKPLDKNSLKELLTLH
tara:strand:+ start:2513 stop:2917 length:405 start_codon:yes stop_codon:yes gene_type:complete